jgi:tetratricopeptide (TPR) repeat protein
LQCRVIPVGRTNAYHDKGEPDHAIEDYDQAIRLNPNLATAFYGRGNAYFAKGKAGDPKMVVDPDLAIFFDRAIADYEHAIHMAMA